MLGVVGTFQETKEGRRGAQRLARVEGCYYPNHLIQIKMQNNQLNLDFISIKNEYFFHINMFQILYIIIL